VLFIYNLQNTLPGWINFYIGSDSCNLYNLAHAKVPGRSWKQFQEYIERPRPNDHPSIQCFTFYWNTLAYNGLSITGYDWPVVALKRGGKREVLLDRQQIIGCRSLIEFETLFHEKMKERVPWYEP
jgi:hypothetical protein